MLKLMKGKNLQSRLLYSERISFRFKGEIKSFTDKQKLREFSTTKPALQQMLKELFYTGNTRESKGLQKRTSNNKVDGNRIIHINNYLKCKRHRLAGQMKPCSCNVLSLTTSLYLPPQIVCNSCIVLS